MKATLQAGLRHTAKFEVTRGRTIDFRGEKPHMRFVVDVASTEERLAAKAAKAGLA
jgi:hypothetical protein